MILNNTTSQNIAFNIDSGPYIEYKGAQFRVVVQANSSAAVHAADVFLLVFDGLFQAEIAAGRITLTYDFQAFFTYILLQALLYGWL